MKLIEILKSAAEQCERMGDIHGRLEVTGQCIMIEITSMRRPDLKDRVFEQKIVPWEAIELAKYNILKEEIERMRLRVRAAI